MTAPQEQLAQIDKDIETVRSDLVDAFDEHRTACEAQLRELLELRDELLKRVCTEADRVAGDPNRDAR